MRLRCYFAKDLSSNEKKIAYLIQIPKSIQTKEKGHWPIVIPIFNTIQFITQSIQRDILFIELHTKPILSRR